VPVRISKPVPIKQPSVSLAAPIVVAGDVSIDWLAFPLPAAADPATLSANWRQQEGTRMVARRGGSLLLADLVSHATGRPVTGPLVKRLATRSPEEHLHSIVDLKSIGSGTFVVERLRGFCGPNGRHPRQPPLERAADAPVLLVLDDSGNGFRDASQSWCELLQRARPSRVICKMARPLATGPLWDAIRHGPLTEDGTRDPERLVVVINADDLRAEGIELSRHLSWERTSEDFVRQLAANGRLDTLVTCADLVVRFDCDGAIHHRGRSVEPPVLYFDPLHAEGDFLDSCPGPMMGMTAAFTAGLVAGLAEDPDGSIDNGIRLGLTAARRIARTGFRAGADGAPDYPYAEVFPDTVPDPGIASVRVPAGRITTGASWSILDDTMGAPTEVARRVVQQGPDAALARVPIGRFGLMVTADRREIESLHAIANLLHEYFATRPVKPISIGVFGPPGSGKSFGVAQVAKQTARGVTLDRLEFNLSQFTQLSDLAAAFQLVRDRTLSGIVPLVFFDEFDTPFGGDLGWLRYFLAPMQDGKFREHGEMHPIGRAIFVFAGGTRRNFAEFSEPMDLPKDNPCRTAFEAVKGPDFISRLRGHFDVLGPDPIDQTDRMYPIRRAILLRYMLRQREPRLLRNERAAIDDGVLGALLTVPGYHHGARSIEAILAMSGVSGHDQFERAALPSEAQLELHVDAKAFMERVRGERLPEATREAIAAELHAVYRRQREEIANARTEEDRQLLQSDPAMVPWEHLSEDLKESNRLEADDIPRKLRAVGCYMAQGDEDRPRVTKLTKPEIEVLAELEHERFNAERLRRQWGLGPRDAARRKNPFLVPWRDLEQKWKSLDRAAVASIPGILAQLDYRIYRLGTELTAADIEVLAAAIHETWRALGKEQGWSMQPHLDKPYDELAEIDKKDNRVAARRIPEVLALVGLGLRKGEDDTPAAAPKEELKAQLERNIERLAEAEHDGWMEHRARNGWRWARSRDDARKRHPDMLPYTKLPDREKGKDRNTIRHYPDFAARAGYRIVPLG
jgi:hypothetical protein